MRRIMAILIVLAIICLIHFFTVANANAQSDYEFYFFGINIKSYQNSNWLKITAGAVVSILVHEMGHALYLQSQGKDWHLQSSSSGLAIHAFDSLSEKQTRNFGRSGFALQTFVSTVLTTFKKTRSSDFTKGWVGINSFQICTYKARHTDEGDFYLIERGGGNSDLELGAFSLLSSYNLLKLEN